MLFRAKTPDTVPSIPGAPTQLLHHYFERQAATAPGAVAVVFGEDRITYAELDHRSEALSRLLSGRGIGPGCCAGLLLPRGVSVYVGLLAILKTGAAYVPLDPDYPPDRVEYILSDCSASVLLTTSELAAKATGFPGAIVCVDAGLPQNLLAVAEVPEKPSTQPRPEDLCYIIYTSGTTGRPKGVQIEHRSACHFVQAESELFEIRPADRVFQGFSIAFDASVEEIWLAWAAGATLVGATAERVRSGAALSQHLSDAGVTVLSCVPTLLAMLEDDVPSLRLLILGGETCPPELVRRWCKSGRRVVNTYGPTEATVVATCAECDPQRPVTIGRPLPGYVALVLNDLLQPVANGDAGELVLGGVGIARGYLGLPKLTAEKFITLDLDGSWSGRFYRTGDRARWSPGGELEFLGRMDTQVKIRGFRVELSEIEAVLLECAAVRNAAVVLREDQPGGARLLAYVVPTSEGPALDPSSLRARLQARLPDYMIPAAIQVLTALPTLPSGKLDRRSLPAPAPNQFFPRPDFVGPRSPVEHQVAELWGTLFQLPAISLNDDFFLDLGGHSLLAAQMVSRLRRLPGFRGVSVADVYRHPRLGEFARRLQDLPGFEGRNGTDGQAGDPHVRPPHAAAGPCGRPVPFWRHFLCGCGQLLSLVFVLSFFALQWLAPYLTYTVLIEEDYSLIPSILLGFASLVLLYPVMLLLVIALKWIIIGRYQPGVYPLWGTYYFRFWLVNAIEATVPVSYLSGTPFLALYLRLMGARIGRNVSLQSDSFAIYDLLRIGDGSSINSDATLLGYSVGDGVLRIGSVTLGKRCFVGTRAVVCENAMMADDAALEDMSLLREGQAIGAGETWIGSPARNESPPGPSGTKEHPTEPSAAACATPILCIALQFAGLLTFPVLVAAALFPGIAVMNRLNYLDPYYWYLFLSPLVALSFVVLLCLEIAGLKWLLLGRIRTGDHSLNSWYYVRKWFVDKTMELSLDILGPLYASVYLSPWYKLLGAKVGPGAEISTASSISPDLVSIGPESFIADNVSLGAPRVCNGRMHIGQTKIGRRAFIGNSAILPPGTVIGDEVLLGCLSAPPRDPAEALREDSAWLGSPALFLPQRAKSSQFSAEATFVPSARLRIVRAAIEFVRVITPSTGFIILISLMFSALLLLHDYFSIARTLLFFPALYLACGLAAAAATIGLKWILVGRYRPGEQPLWCTFVWRNELVNALHEHLAEPFLVGALTGTPFLCWYLRLLGARIGRRVYLETTDFSEFDLARIGDEAALNADCTVQTHLFEDRVMKMSHLGIGAGCTVGAGALVLYDAAMEARSSLGPLSLLMKGETLPAGTTWAGIPARPIEAANYHSATLAQNRA